MNNLLYLRKKAGLTLRKLGDYTKINYSNLAQIEKGKRFLTENHLRTLSNFFKVTTDFLIGKTEMGIYVELENGFTTINKKDYEIYKNNNLIYEIVLDRQLVRKVTKSFEDKLDPLITKDIRDIIAKKMDNMSRKDLEKVDKFIDLINEE